MNRDDFPASIRVDLNIAFNEGLKTVIDTSYLSLVEVVETTSNAKLETFYGADPTIRRWRGERQPQKFFEYKLNMNTDQWEGTRTYKRKDFNNDQGKRLLERAKNFGIMTELGKQKEFWTFLRNGVSTIGFDRANLFDSNHAFVDTSGVTRGGNQSNIHAGGSQLDALTLQLEKQYYSDLLNDQGNKFGLELTDILVYQGSANHKAAMELNNSQFTVQASTVLGQMTPNVFQGSFNIMTTVYGIGASEWMSFSKSNPEFKIVKVLSETTNPGFNSPRFSALGIDPNNESSESFWRGEVSLGVELNFDYNPGYWFVSRLHGTTSYTFTPADSEIQRVLYPNLNQ